MPVSKIPGAGISGGSVTVNQSAPDNSLVITSTGNVGIGTNNPTSALVVSGGVVSPPTVDGVHIGTQVGYATIEMCGTSGTGSFIDFTQSGTDYKGRILYDNPGNLMAFSTNNAERVRIDSSGNLLVGTTSVLASNTMSVVTSGNSQITMRNSGTAAGRFYQVGMDGGSSFLVYNNSAVGVFLGYGGTSWNSSSDETLKADLKPIENASKKVATLRAVTGRFKTDEEGTSRSFLIAQDVQKVLPEAISKAPDGTLGLSYTDTIPLLVAAIKEQQAMIEELKARIETLEAK